MVAPTISFEPRLLAAPALSQSESELEAAILQLASLARHLRENRGYCIAGLSDTAQILATTGHFPSPASLSDALARFNLTHIYSAEDVRRSINEVLTRAERLEKVSGVSFMIPRHVSATPDIFDGVEPAFREALELVLLHNVLVGLTYDPQIITALSGKSAEFELVADIEDIDPPYGDQQLTQFTGLLATIRTTSSVLDFVETVDPEILWRHASDAASAANCISIFAQRLRRKSGCPAPDKNCASFSFGERFYASLVDWEATQDGRHAKLTLETCARLVANMPKNEVKRFRRKNSANKMEDAVRASDQALGWRTHISKRKEALRLNYWKMEDSSIEFSNVGAKGDLDIY